MRASALCMIGISSSGKYNAVSAKAIFPAGGILQGKFPSQNVTEGTTPIVIMNTLFNIIQCLPDNAVTELLISTNDTAFTYDWNNNLIEGIATKNNEKRYKNALSTYKKLLKAISEKGCAVFFEKENIMLREHEKTAQRILPEFLRKNAEQKTKC